MQPKHRTPRLYRSSDALISPLSPRHSGDAPSNHITRAKVEGVSQPPTHHRRCVRVDSWPEPGLNSAEPFRTPGTDPRWPLTPTHRAKELHTLPRSRVAFHSGYHHS